MTLHRFFNQSTSSTSTLFLIIRLQRPNNPSFRGIPNRLSEMSQVDFNPVFLLDNLHEWTTMSDVKVVSSEWF